MNKVLFVDDDLVAHKLVKSALGADFEVISCHSIAETLEVLSRAPQLSAVIIDRGLPDGDGISICSHLRQDVQTESIPILFLSSAGAETDKVGAFYAGADDYITKPFGMLELKARVQARLKRESRKIFAAMLEVDLDTQRARLRRGDVAEEIDLTRTEFKILVTLIQSIDQVFDRERLLSKVWGHGCNVTDRVVDSHISHLRRKVAHAGVSLESIRGEGYRIKLA